MKLNLYDLKNSSILFIYAQRDKILVSPDYQRRGEVWTLDKKQLLIDSIINKFDIPKFYFHDLRDYNPKSKYDFSIVDGKQRLEAIWSFIDGQFTLSKDFEYLRDSSIKAGGLNYKELSSEYPQIKQFFDAYTLSIVVIQTDDLELIEDMFSRLNEAVPLNAAEKRNAYGGPLPKLVAEIASHSFFKKNLKISNKRYQHRDLSAKMLYVTHYGKILDTKKVYLDIFFIANKQKKSEAFGKAVARVKNTLSVMSHAFGDGDKLLKSSSMVMLYYLLFEKAILEKWKKKPSRTKLTEFESLRLTNRTLAEEDISKADYELLEFDRLTQTPNDSFAIKFRLELLEKFVR